MITFFILLYLTVSGKATKYHPDDIFTWTLLMLIEFGFEFLLLPGVIK